MMVVIGFDEQVYSGEMLTVADTAAATVALATLRGL